MDPQTCSLILNKDDEIRDLKHQLMQTENERDRYLKRCQDLEQRLDDETSRYYRELDGRPTTDGRPTVNGRLTETQRQQQQDRIQRRINQEAQDSHVNNLFNQMDQTEVGASFNNQTQILGADAGLNSFLNQSQAVATDLERHAQKLSGQQSNVTALYEQLKHTAKFLNDIVRSFGIENDQIELLMRKIDELQLNVKEARDVNDQLANETKQIINDLTSFNSMIETSIRQRSFVEPVTSFVETSRNTKAYEELVAKNTELIEKDQLLMDEISELKLRLEEMGVNCTKVEQKVSSLNKTNKELVDKYVNTLKLAEDRDEELRNREHIIEQLRELATQQEKTVAQAAKLPADLEKDIENQLQHIYDTLTSVNVNIQKKV